MLYTLLWSRLLQPAYERLRGRATPRLERELERSQWWPAQRLARRQWRDLEVLLRHARREVPFYRDWFREHKVRVRDLVATRDISSLPLVDKRMFMAEPERFRSRRRPPGSFQKTTGGSTGRPLSFLVNPLSDQWRYAVTRRGYGWAGCPSGARQFYLWGADLMPVAARARIKRGLHRMLLRQRYQDCFQLGPRELDMAMRRMERFRPRCLVGYTSPVVALARRARERGWRPPASLGSVITGAEALYPAQRQLIEQALGVPVYETYGSREFMLIAAQCEKRRGLHISAENLMVEVLGSEGPARPGQLGEVVITDLHNLAQPFIRYRSGDLVVMSGEACPCGRGLPCLERVEGRILDMIRTPSGRLLPGEFFPHFLKDFPAIERFQVRQDRLDHLTILLVLRGALSRQDRELILAKTGQALPGMELELRVVEEIPLTPAGKHRVTIGLGEETGA